MARQRADDEAYCDKLRGEIDHARDKLRAESERAGRASPTAPADAGGVPREVEDIADYIEARGLHGKRFGASQNRLRVAEDDLRKSRSALEAAREQARVREGSYIEELLGQGLPLEQWVTAGEKALILTERSLAAPQTPTSRMARWISADAHVSEQSLKRLARRPPAKEELPAEVIESGAPAIGLAKSALRARTREALPPLVVARSLDISCREALRRAALTAGLALDVHRRPRRYGHRRGMDRESVERCEELTRRGNCVEIRRLRLAVADLSAVRKAPANASPGEIMSRHAIS